MCLLAGILITVWPFSPNGNFFHNWLIIVYSLPVGFFLASVYARKKVKKKVTSKKVSKVKKVAKKKTKQTKKNVSKKIKILK